MQPCPQRIYNLIGEMTYTWKKFSEVLVNFHTFIFGITHTFIHYTMKSLAYLL